MGGIALIAKAIPCSKSKGSGGGRKRPSSLCQESGKPCSNETQTGALTVDKVHEALRSCGAKALQARELGRNLVECHFESEKGGLGAIASLHLVFPLGNVDGTDCLLGLFRKRQRIEPSVSLSLEQKVPESLSKPGFVSVSSWSGEHPLVQGLFLFADFCDKTEEEHLLENVWPEGETEGSKKRGRGDWEPPDHRRQPERRRVKHFGYKFDYGTRRCDQGQPLGPLPEWLGSILGRINQAVRSSLGQSSAQWSADQITINEYVPGQGIAPHVDTHSAFHDGIASLSLGSAVTMRFDNEQSQHHVLLPSRSLLVMTGPARYKFTHGIPQRKSDLVDGRVVPRSAPRVSLTLRKIKAGPKCDNCPFPSMCDLTI